MKLISKEIADAIGPETACRGYYPVDMNGIDSREKPVLIFPEE